jgi:hypothetical protein
MLALLCCWSLWSIRINGPCEAADLPSLFFRSLLCSHYKPSAQKSSTASSSTTAQVTSTEQATGKATQAAGQDPGSAADGAQQPPSNDKSLELSVQQEQGGAGTEVANRSQAVVVPSSEALLLQYAIQGGSTEIINALLEAGELARVLMY